MKIYVVCRVRVCENAWRRHALDRRLYLRRKAAATLLPPCSSAGLSRNAGACAGFPDRLANRWSYFAARMRSATVLAAQSNGSSEFSGYVVPRSSGQQAGGLLRRTIALVGSGAKALRYFKFGPGVPPP